MSHQTGSSMSARHSHSSSSWSRCSRANDGAAQCPQRPSMAPWRCAPVRQIRRASRSRNRTWLWRRRCRPAPHRRQPRQQQPSMACTGRVRPLISCCPHTPFTDVWAGVSSGVPVLAKVSPQIYLVISVYIYWLVVDDGWERIGGVFELEYNLK